jgi:myotubularin-related protein 6/7/8
VPAVGGASHLIMDARPATNAMAQSALGAGTEIIEHYRGCRLAFSGIENIHVVRDSLGKVLDGTSFVCFVLLSIWSLIFFVAIQSSDDGLISQKAIEKSGWMYHIKTLIDGALMIVQHVHSNNNHVLVHCRYCLNNVIVTF